jgi:hypothetical protein
MVAPGEYHQPSSCVAEEAATYSTVEPSPPGIYSSPRVFINRQASDVSVQQEYDQPSMCTPERADADA